MLRTFALACLALKKLRWILPQYYLLSSSLLRYAINLITNLKRPLHILSKQLKFRTEKTSQRTINYNMARLVQHPTKYTPEEWHRSNHLNYNSAERERKSAEMIRDESNRLKHEVHITTIKTQSDVNKKLDQRIQDINFWKSEIDRLHGETDDEINALIQYKERLEKALDGTQLPLHVAKQCLANRNERLQIDLVHDDVEIQLIKVSFKF